MYTEIIINNIKKLLSAYIGDYEYNMKFEYLVKKHIKHTTTKKVIEFILPNLKKYELIFREGGEANRWKYAEAKMYKLFTCINILVKYGSVIKYKNRPILSIYDGFEEQIWAQNNLRDILRQRFIKPLLMQCVYFIRNNRHLYQYDIFKLCKDLRVYFI